MLGEDMVYPITLISLGCEQESKIKEHIEVVEKMDPKLKAISVSPEQGLTIWVPKISNNPKFTVPLQVLVGTKLGMPSEMQKTRSLPSRKSMCHRSRSGDKNMFIITIYRNGLENR